MTTIRKIKRISTIQVELTVMEAALLTWLAGQSYSHLSEFYQSMCAALGSDIEEALDEVIGGGLKKTTWDKLVDDLEEVIEE